MPLTFNNSIYNQLKLFFWIISFISIHENVLSQQLIINEVSQGPSGAKEYVELLVTGTSTCNGIPCMDLRNYIIDDNNGNHASGAGTGIASGCVRLKNISFWQCIPYGTIVLIYNDADLNTSIPPIDLSMLDGNCRLIIPISNCTLLERFDTQPTTANAFYPINSMFTNCGNWGPVSMANGDDSFQTISPTGTLLHAVSWGNNTLNTIIYFAGSSGGSVAMMTNAMDNNPANQANWSLVTVAGNETPGTPNNLANSIWINSMNNACQPFLPFTASVTSIPAGCSCNGSATLTVAGAIAPYTYTWLPNGGNSNIATGLCSGTYTILSSSFNGCLQSTTVSIASAGSLSATIVKSNVSCIGLANGSATVIQNSGNPPFTYTWIPSGGNSAVANGLSAGTYTVLYSDANNCNGTGTVNITQPTSITNTVVINNTNCGSIVGTGGATITVSGGTPGYIFNWLPAGGTNSIATGLLAGSYTASITDANGCISTAVANIIQTGSLNLSISKTNVSCNNGTNGSATVSVSSGTSPYFFNWLPNSINTNTINNLSVGVYTVIVSDANNCNGTGTVNITQPTAITNSVVINNTNCGSTVGTGGATITVSGGTPGYTINWLPAGGTNSVVTGLLAGSYTANITDANGCNSNVVATILQIGSLNISISKTNVGCNSGTNGSAAVSVSGGSSPYSYNWLPNSATSNTINNLSAGVYTVIVSDANNCNGTGTVNITQPTAIANSVVINNTNCGSTFGTGGATITVNGGTAGYTFNWLPAGGTNSVATGLLAGSYTVNITDANGCNSNTVATILQTGSLNLSISKTNVSCNGGTNGSATVSVSGGSSPYSYNWLPNSATSNTINNLSAGVYTVIASDVNNCNGSGTISINQPLPIIANVNALKLCYGQNGLLISNISGGSLPYSYFWNNISGTNNLSINPIATSIYSLYVIDANGCQSNIDSAQVTIGNQLTLNASPSKTICAGNSVQLFAQANGGTGNYQYSWLPGAMAGQSITTTPTATIIYTVNVTDGCSQPQASQLITITIENLSQSIINADKFSGCAPLCVSFSNSSFLNNTSIQSSIWNFSDGSSLISISPTYCFNKTGSYTAYNTFTTSSGCKDSVKLNKIITIYPKPLANFVASTNSVTTDAPTIQFSNLSTNATNYYWDFAGMSNSNNFNTYYNFSNTGKHLVTLVAFNEFCSDTAFKLIESFPEFTFYAPNTFTPNKDNINDIFLPIGEGWDTASFSMEIFNRWGELIFYSKKYNEGWNADYKNTRVKNDIYVWKVSLKDIFGKQHRYIGKITVLN